MNPYKHSELSVRRRGGKIEDYYKIHSFMDSTKELLINKPIYVKKEKIKD